MGLGSDGASGAGDQRTGVVLLGLGSSWSPDHAGTRVRSGGAGRGVGHGGSREGLGIGTSGQLVVVDVVRVVIVSGYVNGTRMTNGSGGMSGHDDWSRRRGGCVLLKLIGRTRRRITAKSNLFTSSKETTMNLSISICMKVWE